MMNTEPVPKEDLQTTHICLHRYIANTVPVAQDALPTILIYMFAQNKW